MTEWVSHRAAAVLVGCSPSTLEAHLDEIAHRSRHGGRASIDLASAIKWGTSWRAVREARRKPRHSETVNSSPPDDGEIWLDTVTAGLILGCTRTYVARLADQGRLPATRCGTRWWIRRRDIEQRAAARALRQRHRNS